MSCLGAYELTHPESLSERQLREILKNSCIESLNFEKLCKDELLEMYKRVAMPLPQRKRGNAKSSDIQVEMMTEKSIITTSDNIHSSTQNLNKESKRSLHSTYPQTDDGLKLTDDEKSVQKKIRLSSAKVEITCNGSKRRCDEQTEELLTKKHKKITWP